MAGFTYRGKVAVFWLIGAVAAPSLLAQAIAISDDQSIQSSPNNSGALFGISVSTDADLIAVGASDYSDTMFNGGTVFLFGYDGNDWSQTDQLEPDDVMVSDFFGFAVGVSGDTLVSGAWGSDSLANLSGAAYVFERDLGGADAWGQQAKLLAPDAGVGDVFGYSVAIDADTIAVGAPLDDSSGFFEAGGVYIYTRDVATGDWSFLKKLIANDPNTDAQFGFSLALDGDRLVVGSVGSSVQGNGSGAVYVFERAFGGADNWGQVTKLTGSDVDANDQFGQSVAVDGDRIVVGASKRNRESVFSGAVFVFDRDFGGDGAWGESATFRADEPVNLQAFGGSVSIADGVILVGAEATPVDGMLDSGTVFVFVEDDQGGWNQELAIAPETSDGGELLGGATAIMPDGDGLRCVLGARGAGGVLAPFTGAVRVLNISEEVACLADVAPPEGVLNFFDISAFITLFNAGDPAADFAEPFGVLNFFDISAFISAFNVGCP
ncbi:MAG: GC-type dockerin domain-anchored protein [Phycisphaerales bacterium]